jgi:glycosyltransferase involved in cell wall biosynthesis
MHITLVDDSIPFDAFTPAVRALGGAEKAFASLAGALARLGHDVHVYNRTPFPLIIEGAHWETLDKAFPGRTDALIAFRKPSLLSSVRLAGKRLLWVTASARQLEPARKAIDSFRPALVFLGQTQLASWQNKEDLVVRALAPAVRLDFLADTPTVLADRPTAVVTSHPAHGLAWLLDRWTTRIQPAVPNGRLVVVSSILDKGKAGGEISDEMRPLLDRALAAEGVEIMAPCGDSTMAELYRSARVHLYPGHPDDMACWTLMESQACGLPAVARPLGAVHERLDDGQTAHIVPDDDAFANVAVRLLTDDEMFWSDNRDARLSQRGNNWDAAAEEFIALI